MTRTIRDAIADTGAVLEGEYFFALKSGKVSTKYINMDPVFTHPKLVAALATDMIGPWLGEIDVIAAPAVGAIPLLYASGKTRSPGMQTVWADKQKDGTFAFERMGFKEAVRGRRALIVEDIVSTGGSGKAVCDLVRASGGIVVGASFIWNRGNVSAEEMGVPKLQALVNESVQMWEPGAHAKWGKWPLVEDIGHPEKFPSYRSRIKLQK